MPMIPREEIDYVLSLMPRQRPFSSIDVIELLQTLYPKTWDKLIVKYGQGGKGAGRHFTAYSAVGRTLSAWSKRGDIHCCGNTGAPPHWGSPALVYWSFHAGNGVNVVKPSPDLAEIKVDYLEGGRCAVSLTRIERSEAARRKCIDHWKPVCACCNFNFYEVYGERGRGFIHVHHLKPLADKVNRSPVDYINDLRPVCANCHSMIHRQKPMLTVKQLKRAMKERA